MFAYEAVPDLLRERVILVTGAGRGIGAALAHGLARYGATIVLAGRDLQSLESVYDSIVASGHPEPLIQEFDLETVQPASCQVVADALDTQFGCLHGLVHNAALLGPRSPIEHYDAAAWAQVMQVNVNGAFVLTSALLPMLRAAPDSSIIFTSSGVGRRGRAYWGAYAVSKFANEGLSQVLADELEACSNVRVNCLNPGATRTAMRQAAYPAEDPTVNPLPENLLPAYLYLLGRDSIGLTGQSLDAQHGQPLPLS